MYDIVKNYATGTKSSRSEGINYNFKVKFRYEVRSLRKESEIRDRMDLRTNGKILKDYLEDNLNVKYTGSHNPYSFNGDNKVEVSYPNFWGFGFNLKITTNKFQSLADMINLYELNLLIEYGIEIN